MDYLAYFFAGIFLANGVPHFFHGISGNKFQSPFASPPGVGESSPLINVLWGALNFVVGVILIYAVGNFEGGLTADLLAVGVGVLTVGITLAIWFGRVRGGSDKS